MDHHLSESDRIQAAPKYLQYTHDQNYPCHYPWDTLRSLVLPPNKPLEETKSGRLNS